MADALASGASVRKDVGVQVPPRALKQSSKQNKQSLMSYLTKLSNNLEMSVLFCSTHLVCDESHIGIQLQRYSSGKHLLATQISILGQ